MGFDLEFLALSADMDTLVNREVTLEDILARPTPVKKGQTVARELVSGAKSPDSKGRARIKLPEGERAPDVLGDNVTVSKEDPSLVLSLIDGYMCESDGLITVTRMFEVFGDVGPSTGDIESENTVRIHGGVMDGYKVKSGSDVEVLGLVEAAEIRAGRNIALKGGITGGEKGIASAGKDLYAKFAQQCRLEAEGSILVEGPVMSCELSASKKVIIKGRASLVGGVTRAREEVWTTKIGSEGALPTEVILGQNPFEERKRAERHKKLGSLREELEAKSKEVNFAGEILKDVMSLHPDDPLSDIFFMSDVHRSGGLEGLDEDQKEHFEQLGRSLLTLIYLSEEIKRLEDEDESHEEEKPFYKAFLKVDDIAHPGVSISILNHTMTLNREYERPRFFLKEGEIQITEF